MAFEQNAQLKRLLDPVALQQMAYDQDRQYNRSGLPMPQNNQRQGNFGQQFPMQQPQGLQIGSLPGTQQGRGFWGAAFGTPEQQISNIPYDEQQSQIFQLLQQMGLQNLQDPYNGFDQLKQDVYKEFNENVLPDISNRFTSMGGGAPSSPDFTKQLQGGIRGLQDQYLQSRIGYGNQNRELGMQQLRMGLTPQRQTSYIPAEPGFVQQSIPVLANGFAQSGGVQWLADKALKALPYVGAAAGSAFGGIGAGVGGALGAAGQYFGNRFLQGS
jgi:hypothetical protein